MASKASMILVLLCFLLASAQTAALRVNGAPPSPSAARALLHRSTVGASLIASLLVFDPAAAADLNGSGQKLFAANCAGCHIGGGDMERVERVESIEERERVEIVEASSLAHRERHTGCCMLITVLC
jgi:mono/diheme cytochrome c family protein